MGANPVKIIPHAILDGTNHYIFDPQSVGDRTVPVNESDSINFEITLQMGKKFLSQI